MLAGKHLPGASETALNFVSNKQHAMFVADIHQDAKKFKWRCDEATFSENRLSNHRGNVFRSNHAPEGVLKMARAVHVAGRILERVRTTVAVAIWNAVNVGRKWSKAGLVRMSFAGKRKPHHGAAVKSVFEGDDSRTPSVGPSDFDGIFDGFGAGVQKNCLFGKIAWSYAVQSLGQTNVFFIRRDLGTGMQKILELRFNRRKHCLVAMAGVDAADSSSEIEKAIAVHVFKPCVLGTRDVDLRRMR